MDRENGAQQAQANEDEAIRLRAYYVYLDRINAGCNGDELGDWLQAKQESGAAEVAAS